MLLINFVRSIIAALGCLAVYGLGVGFNLAVAIAGFTFVLTLVLTLGDLAEEYLISHFDSET